VHQENAGLPAARNRGCRESHGELLVFLDADDWLDPRFCERMTRSFREDTRWGFAYCDVLHVNEAGGPPPPELADYSVGRSRQTTTGNLLASLLVGGYFPPCTVMVPRGVLDAVGPFDVDLGGHADWDLWLRISASGFPACYVDERLAYYRVHDHSMSKDVEHMRATALLVLEKLLRRFPEQTAVALRMLIETVLELCSANRGLQREFVRLDRLFQEASRLREEESRKSAEVFSEQQRWIAALQEGKDWNEKQAANWRAEAERLAALLQSGRDPCS
jgi:glycosyltransferase involved in cell wall biosynthesis